MEAGEEEREVEAAFPEEKREEALSRPPGRASRPGAEWVWKWSGLRRQVRILWPGC